MSTRCSPCYHTTQKAVVKGNRMQVKEGCTKIWHGTLEALPHAIAGIHTFIYSGFHVLAVGVIPLLAFRIVTSNSLLLSCDSLPTSSTWKLGLAWTWVGLDITRRCDHQENYIRGYIFLGLNILSGGWVSQITGHETCYWS